jgi:hypothetical protein
MSIVKAVPEGLKDPKCKKITLRKHPPFPCVPKKDCIQETVSAYKDNHLRTQIGKGTELQVPIWHSGKRKAFLIYVGSTQEAIKKKRDFKAYSKANKAHLEHCIAIQQAQAQLAMLDGSTGLEAWAFKKSKKAQELAEAGQADPALYADLLAEIKQAKSSTDNVKAKGEHVAADMFQLYASLLSVNAKYAWNKIVQEQTASDPYTDLQG